MFQKCWRLIIAHRGNAHLSPENTLSALRAAKNAGALWVEFDVQRIHTGELVVFHDDTVDRTTNSTGTLSHLTFNQLRQLDAGSWFNPAFSGEPIPLLADYLLLAIELGLHLNLEIKVFDTDIPSYVEDIDRLVNMHWLPSHGLNMLISSSSGNILLEYRKKNPMADLAYVCDQWDGEARAIVKDCQCVSVHLDYRYVTQEIINEISALGYFVLCYTVNDSSIAMKLFDQGVLGVFSDNPALLQPAHTLRK